jgi:hypothetical protein
MDRSPLSLGGSSHWSRRAPLTKQRSIPLKPASFIFTSSKSAVLDDNEGQEEAKSIINEAIECCNDTINLGCLNLNTVPETLKDAQFSVQIGTEGTFKNSGWKIFITQNMIKSVPHWLYDIKIAVLSLSNTMVLF